MLALWVISLPANKNTAAVAKAYIGTSCLIFRPMLELQRFFVESVYVQSR